LFRPCLFFRLSLETETSLSGCFWRLEKDNSLARRFFVWLRCAPSLSLAKNAKKRKSSPRLQTRALKENTLHVWPVARLSPKNEILANRRSLSTPSETAAAKPRLSASFCFVWQPPFFVCVFLTLSVHRAFFVFRARRLHDWHKLHFVFCGSSLPRIAFVFVSFFRLFALPSLALLLRGSRVPRSKKAKRDASLSILFARSHFPFVVFPSLRSLFPPRQLCGDCRAKEETPGKLLSRSVAGAKRAILESDSLPSLCTFERNSTFFFRCVARRLPSALGGAPDSRLCHQDF